MKRRFIQRDGELVEVVDGYIQPRAMIQPDIQPYKSMVDGTVIEGRAQHREHLKRHGVVEIGNDIRLAPKPMPDAAPAQRKELIRAQVDAMNEGQFKRALQRDIDFVKWNSRR